MEAFYLEKINEVRKLKSELEKRLKIKIEIRGKQVCIDGDSLDEYDASLVFEAIQFGFSVKKSLTLKSEETIFKRIHVKSHTKRNLKDAVGRIIGLHGKTKKTLMEISGCYIVIKDGEVGIIGDVESANNVETAILGLIRGSKQANMYRYLQRMNKKNENQKIFNF